MAYIRERKLKDGSVRYQVEIRMKGRPPLTGMFDRKTDAKDWIQQTESDIRRGRYQLYSGSNRHTFKEAIERYAQEQEIADWKKSHIKWWMAELGPLYLQDIRPAIISEKKQKLLRTINEKGKLRSRATCNRYLATLSHVLAICTKQWEWTSENPVSKIARENDVGSGLQSCNLYK